MTNVVSLSFVALALVPAIFAAENTAAFRVELDLTQNAKLAPLSVTVPAPARKVFKRYEQLVESSNPVLVGRGFVPSVKGKGEDKTVEWIASANAKRNSLVLQTANFSKTDRTIELSLAESDRRMLSPVYRRVYFDEKEKSWKRMAWETPRNSDVRPWTVEVPANTVQTVLIRLKEAKK